MTASPPHPVAGIDLGPPTLSVAVRTATGVRVQACPEPVGGGTAGLTVDHSAGEPRTSAEVVDHLGERVFLPVCDTYYPAAALLTALLAAVRRTAEQMERGSGRCAAVAHPVDWPAWRLRALEAAVRAAGFDAVDLIPAPEAAAWAPTGGPAPDPGLVLVFDLSDTPSVALLKPDGDGPHLIDHRPLHPADRPTAVARALLDGAGRRLAEVSEVRAVGAGATEAQTQQIGDELATTVRVPRFPESAVAVGALHRSLWSRRTQPVPDPTEHNSSIPQPDPDIAEPVPDSAQPLLDPAPVPSGSDAPTVPTPLAPRYRRSRPEWPRRKVAWVGAGLAAAMLAIVGLVALLLPGGTPRTSTLEREFPVSAEAIDTVVAAERDGKPVVISGGNVHAIQVSNPVDGTQLGSWPVDDAVHSLAVESPATSAGPPPVVVSASPNHAVHVFDPQSGKQLGMWSQPNVPVTAIATAGSGGRPTVVCGGGDGTLTFWWTDGRQRAYPPVPASGNTASNISALAVGQVGGSGVVVSGAYGTISAWDLDTGAPRWSRTAADGVNRRYVTSVAIGQLDGQPVVVVGGDDGDGDNKDGKITVWSLENGAPQGAAITDNGGRKVTAVAVAQIPSRPDPVIVSGDAGGDLRLWDLRSHQQLGETITGHTTASVLSLTTVQVGQAVLAVSSGEDGYLRTWDLAMRVDS